MPSSVRKWVEELPWMMQGVLFSNIRGCDGSSREDNSKTIIRGYRNLILMPARSKGNFLGRIPTYGQLEEAMKQFTQSFDEYPIHFVLHLIHAAEVVGYKHPVFEVSSLWFRFYFKLVKAMHLFIEQEEQLDLRLSDDLEMVDKNLKENE